MAPGGLDAIMQVLGVAGPSGAGKTTLVERLVPRLVEGHDPDARARVATVKSIHHDVEVDEPGKDTHRHREAGAAATVGLTPSRTFGFVERGKANHAGEAGALEPVLSGFADEGVDYGLVEGFASASIPKVAVGDADEGGMAEPVVARVEDGATADVGPVVDAIEGVRSYETAASVAASERRVGPMGAVAVVSTEASGFATGTDWTGGRVPDSLRPVRDEFRDHAAVDRVAVHVRPPVDPGGTAAVHVGVIATEAEPAFDAASAVADWFAASPWATGPVEYLVRQG